MNLFKHVVEEHHLHWTAEVFDCDDWAWLLKVVMAMSGINACLYAEGWVYDLAGRLLGRHAFNLLLYCVDEDCSNVALTVVEPQLFPWIGSLCFLGSGNKCRVGDWVYEVEVVVG